MVYSAVLRTFGKLIGHVCDFRMNQIKMYDAILCSSFSICFFPFDIIFRFFIHPYIFAFFLVFVFTRMLESAFLSYRILHTKRIVRVELNKYRNHMRNTNKVIGVPLEG